ncbi:unnamed protein product [Schistocephalus solidus]|uniref:Uncharacterized protein n=1 Tax=Schistocephalus solidus TaxID=70667 RepID=A0A3P7DBF8_SCHSO|nr:unnamed protein product [Schistocephalus solidus]
MVSAPRIYSSLKELKNRPLEMNEALATSLASAGGEEVLSAFLRRMFNTCKNCASDKHLIECLVLVCEFLVGLLEPLLHRGKISLSLAFNSFI